MPKKILPIMSISGALAALQAHERAAPMKTNIWANRMDFFLQTEQSFLDLLGKTAMC